MEKYQGSTLCQLGAAATCLRIVCQLEETSASECADGTGAQDNGANWSVSKSANSLGRPNLMVLQKDRCAGRTKNPNYTNLMASQGAKGKRMLKNTSGSGFKV